MTPDIIKKVLKQNWVRILKPVKLGLIYWKYILIKKKSITNCKISRNVKRSRINSFKQ